MEIYVKNIKITEKMALGSHLESLQKKLLLGSHLESVNFVHILIRLIIPHTPPFGTETDTLCAILLEIYVKNIKIMEKMATGRPS